MHGLDRPITRQLPPKAQRIPKFSVHHGVELVDEYAWLRADNWQEVMRDPEALDQQIRAYLEAENAYTEAALADTAALQKTLYAEMQARIKEDDSSVPAPDGAFEYFASYVTGGQYPRLCRQPARRRRRAAIARRQQGGRGQALLAVGGGGAQPRPQTPGLRRRRQGIGAFHDPHPRSGNRPDLPDAIPDTRSAIVWARDSQTLFYVRLDANQRPLFVYRHRVGTRAADDVLVYEEKDSGFYVGVGQTQSSKFITIEAHDHQTTEIYLIDADRPESGPRLVVPREHWPRVCRGAPRRQLDHHHQLRGRRGLPRLRGSGGGAGAGQLARDHRPQARPPDPGGDRLSRPPRPARARGRPAAHRHSPLRRRCRARHRLCRGGLFARHFRRLRVRHHHPALHLLVDDDAGPGVRLRHGGAHAHPAQDAGGAERPQPRRLRHAPTASARRRRRERARLAALSQGNPARRLGAALPLWLRRLRHRHAGELLHQPAQPGRSRLRVRHRPHPRRQGQGLSLVYGRQAARRSSTPSRTSSPRPSSWQGSATPDADASSPTAARPAAC